MSAWDCGSNAVSFRISNNTNLSKEATYLHADVGVAHPSVHSQLGQLMPAVSLHGIENRFRLEACSFHGGSGDVPSLCVLCDTDYEHMH